MATKVELDNITNAWRLGVTAAEIEDAAAKSSAISNSNLLDNWYFGNPVNRRGQAEYAGIGYTIDRWKLLTANGILTLQEGAVIFSSTSSSATTWRQYLDNPEEYYGKTVTLSALTADGRLLSGTSTLSASVPAELKSGPLVYLDTAQKTYIACVFLNDGRLGVQFKCALDYPVHVIAAKLELGTRQTLAHQDAQGNWLLNEIPNYSEQLLRCITSTADSSDTYASKELLHTGNRPAGSYSGNGSAASRTVDTGGSGNVVMIRGGALGAILSANGGIAWDTSTGSTRAFASSAAKFVGGVLTLATDSYYLNSASLTYYYQVL